MIPMRQTGVDETVIRVFSKPLVPSKPVSPKKKLTVAIAGVLGSVVGMGLVILLGPVGQDFEYP
jgi:uncharacterized protein involved in exopolysaccharide biosynthesis